jgi:hypothetical protein
MLAAILLPMPLAVLSVVQIPQPPRDCWLEMVVDVLREALPEGGRPGVQYQ